MSFDIVLSGEFFSQILLKLSDFLHFSSFQEQNSDLVGSTAIFLVHFD